MIAAYPPFGSSSFKMVAKGLVALHTLGKAGKDESPEADSVRDSLDLPLAALNRIEKERAQWLSEDLYSVSEPSLASQKEMNPQAQQQLSEAIEAQLKGEWDRALGLLRRWKDYIAPSLLSYRRGTIWLGAGIPEIATMFYGHATEIDPSTAIYQVGYLLAVAKSDPVLAEARVKEILDDHEQHPPMVVAQAGMICVRNASIVNFNESDLSYQNLLPIFEKTLVRIKSDEDAVNRRLSYDTIIFLLGHCHERLGNSSAAVAYFSQGIQLDPLNDASFTSRGILLYGSSPRAISDFEQAVGLGSPLIWPYFFLAHHHLIASRFDQCRSICETGLKMIGSNSAKSQLEEWRAIAQAELGFPPELVRMAFEAAIRLDPTNESAKRNQDAYEAYLKTPHSDLRSIWEQKSNSAIRQFGLAERRYSLAA